LGELVAEGATARSRNESIRKLIAYIDVRYMHFRHDIVANGKHSGAIASGLTLATDIAATLTESTGVKDNYIALSALIQGGETIYNKEYLFQRTLDALVTQMDASRKSKLVEIRRSMLLDVTEYPGESAIADIFDYYYAGTINGAIVHTQKTASEDESKSSEALRTLTDRSPEQIAATRKANDRIGSFVDSLDSEQQQRLRGFLSGKDIVLEDGDDKDEANLKLRLRYALNDLHRDVYPDFNDMIAALAAAGFKVPD
jgi:hypothetical protein